MAEQEKSRKARKKKWFTITADGLFGNAFLGESLVYAANDLMKRVVTANLMTLTNDVKQQNVSVRLKIDQINGENAVAKIISYEVMPSSIKRMVRKEVERVDASFVAVTNDGVKLRIKPLMITRSATTQSKSRMLRRMSTEFIVSFANKSTFDDFCRAVLGKSLQGQLKIYLKRILPLKAVEIRRFEITTRGTPVTLTGGTVEMPPETPRKPKTEQAEEQPVETQ
ncbi:MAG: hypothetical protein EPN86_05455 [Nanoarchaeota archaeon]|nr:MAG: hypothetical protein EPN86_05455 [Nanoarchaeota archaeon]